MMDIKNMNDAEIQEILKTLNDELVRRQRARRANVANKALDALEELIKIAPYCYVDMMDDPDANEDSTFLKPLVNQWKAQNFHFD